MKQSFLTSLRMVLSVSVLEWILLVYMLSAFRLRVSLWLPFFFWQKKDIGNDFTRFVSGGLNDLFSNLFLYLMVYG